MHDEPTTLTSKQQVRAEAIKAIALIPWVEPFAFCEEGLDAAIEMAEILAAWVATGERP